METFKEISKSAGYKSLKEHIMYFVAEAKKSKEKGWGSGRGTKLYANSSKNEYSSTFKWVIDRAKHYSHKTGVPVSKILDAWEKDRSYWFMNYYQDCNQPKLTGTDVIVVDTKAELIKLYAKGFRCPACNGITSSPVKCNSGIKRKGKVCDWAAYGFLGTLGKGIHVFLKYKAIGKEIFMPITIEEERTRKK